MRARLRDRQPSTSPPPAVRRHAGAAAGGGAAAAASDTVKIPAERIGLLVGPSGATIKGIEGKTGAHISVDADGTIYISSSNADSVRRAKDIISSMFKEIQVGETYEGSVVTIKDFGCFVKVLPGKDILVHISELSNSRVSRVEDVVQVGDSIRVKCIGVDDSGRFRFSRKAAMRDGEQGGGPAGA
jgi:polyribonucleotide nucleotidyltransferase